MQIIDQYSRAIIEFSLIWKEGEIRHQDSFWADPVSFWRDILEPELVRELIGQQVGGRATVDIVADRFFQSFSPKKRVLVSTGQFRNVDAYGNSFTLTPSRYYPQGLLSGVDGLFRVSNAPCRYLGREDEKLVFDLNHPLAGRDLRLQAEIKAIHPQQKERGGRCEDWLERISADGPGMQAGVVSKEGLLSIPDNFRRLDEQPDIDFYRQPRFVYHLDSTAREEIGTQYGRLIPQGARVLDLMGSWASHLPDDLALDSLTVLGLNADELHQNSRATHTVVHDLNHESRLPFANASFDAVICTASIEYLTSPLAVMAEITRVLRPKGILTIAFSNRWFPPKVIKIWPELHEFERLGLVTDMLLASGGFEQMATLSRRWLPRPADDSHQELFYSDPLYMVWGNRI
jgi:SAM-dependent methyltransferase